ncbi:MAG: RnfABCDGE type electron transport complex subunit D [Clostridia bacterium]|nr:RnfABCDGE type electron transport complex subunit D [Clostridia bacterium]
MPDENKILTVSASPHVKSKDSTQRIMLDVVIALIPAGLAGCFIFGGKALLVIGLCVFFSVLFEYLSRKIMKRSNTLGDLSAVVTGLLLAYNIPVLDVAKFDGKTWKATVMTVFLCLIGSFFAIVVTKQFFGGLGQNFANPAIVGRIVLLVSFPSAMTAFTVPKAAVDAVTSATPLGVLSDASLFDRTGDIGAQLTQLSGDGYLPDLFSMFIGVKGGCIGEVSGLLILLGGFYLLMRGVISPAIPVSFIGTVSVFMLIAGKGNLPFVAYELLGGGLLLGAIFMATDYTTSPITVKGKVIFGIGCGVICSVIRLFGSMAEGVSYAILLMNIACPLIEMLTKPRPFGVEKTKKSKKEGNAA